MTATKENVIGASSKGQMYKRKLGSAAAIHAAMKIVKQDLEDARKSFEGSNWSANHHRERTTSWGSGRCRRIQGEIHPWCHNKWRRWHGETSDTSSKTTSSTYQPRADMTIKEIRHSDANIESGVWNWQTNCVCGEGFGICHALSCKNGGLITIRHNELRYINAKLSKEICHDVRTELPLVEVNEVFHETSTNTRPEARLDISTFGFLTPDQRIFLR